MQNSVFLFLVLFLLGLSGCNPFDADEESPSSPAPRPKQYTYQRVLKMIDEVAVANPDNVERISLDLEDDALELLKIGSGDTHVLVVSTHHGNEYGSTEVALALMQSLASHPLKDLTVYVLPVLNISGYITDQRRERGVDPNRDYPGPCGSASGGPFLLDSTTALGHFLEDYHITTAITLHTYMQVVTFPWGFRKNSPTDHHPEFLDLSQKATAINGYRNGLSANLIYTTRGEFQSFAFWKHGIWPFLFELGVSHRPSEQDIRHMINLNVPAIRELLVNSPKQRAVNHNYAGGCTKYLLDEMLDLHDE